jgi:hypothetical protein
MVELKTLRMVGLKILESIVININTNTHIYYEN